MDLGSSAGGCNRCAAPFVGETKAEEGCALAFCALAFGGVTVPQLL